MWKQGKRLMDGLESIIGELGVDARMTGVPPLPLLRFTEKNETLRESLKKAFYVETTRKGVLFHPNHCWFLSLGHTDEDIDITLEISRSSMRAAKENMRV
jgi:glutamate-1-semialdehyde aminotransferase